MKFIVKPQKMEYSTFCFCSTLFGSEGGCSAVCRGNCGTVCSNNCGNVGGGNIHHNCPNYVMPQPGGQNGDIFGPDGLFGPGGLFGRG